MSLPKKKSLYKGQKSCSELACLIVKEFMVVTATYGKVWTEYELKLKVDEIIMAYFKKATRQYRRKKSP